jgi:site-specific DNA-methyltransferase (adenine-specific)/modification methylase
MSGSDYDAADNSAKSYALAIETMREKLESFHRVQIGDCTLYLGDCREILPLLPKVDAVVTDPPYGIGYDPKQYDGAFSAGITGDSVAFDPAVLLGIQGRKIFWGANNYADKLPRGGWLVWDKRCSEAADRILGSPFELAWTDNAKTYRIARILHAGKLNADGMHDKLARVHPTQKPIKLMQWCIEQLPLDDRTILDPFMGSGTTGVACVKLGRKFIGIEIEPKYFEIACKRIQAAYDQPDMFVAPPSKQPEQLQLLGAAE